MNTTGKVFSLLVTSGNLPVLTSGSLDSLAEGQIGLFNNETSMATTVEDAPRNIFFAVKNNGKIKTSAGQHIQSRLISAINGTEPSEPMNFIFEITDYKAECETDYALKLEVRNGDIYQRQGFVQFTDTFAVRTGCCDKCITDDCNTGNKFQLTNLLVEAIKIANKDYIASVEIIAGPNGYVIEDLAEYEAESGSDAPVGIRITLGAAEMNQGSNINLLYKYNRASWGIPVLVDGFGCSGKVTVTQEASPGEGLGYDLRQKEYFEKGWTDSPYRTNVLTGLAKTEYSNYVTKENEYYSQFAIVHNHYTEAGWGEYINELATLFAVPKNDTNTLSSLSVVLGSLAEKLNLALLDLSTPKSVEQEPEPAPVTEA